jgi:hypothetical protein
MKESLYLISYRCDGYTPGKHVVKAQSALYAWNKFIHQWNEDVNKEICEAAPKDLVSFSIEKICSSEDIIL